MSSRTILVEQNKVSTVYSDNCEAVVETTPVVTVVHAGESGFQGTAGADGVAGADGAPTSPWPVTALGTIGATISADMTGNAKYFAEGATSATALTISINNPPASGNHGEVVLILDTTTLPVSITWPVGHVDEPTITAGKVWELNFVTIDGGTTWRILGKEWTA